MLMNALRAALVVTPALLCLTLLPATGQAATVTGSGTPATEARSVPAFQAIALSGAIDLVVRQGPQQPVQVEADDNLLPLLETVVEPSRHGATLSVRWKKGQSLSTRSPVRITVVVPQLAAIAAAGSGDIRVESFNTPALSVALSGSGDARLQGLTAGELSVSISGSSDVAGSGTAGRLKVGIAGSGDVRLADLKADEVTVSIAGSGDAAVHAARTLKVSIAGSGDVSYSGNPEVKSSVAGSGGVTRR